MPSSAADSEEDLRQAKLAKMRKALAEAGVDTVSRADAHVTQVEVENSALRLQVSSLSAQLSAAQQSSAFFRRLLFSESRERVAADKRAKATLKQTAAANLNSAMPRHESYNTQDSNSSNKSATADATCTSTCRSTNPSCDTNASTAGAGISTAVEITSPAEALMKAAPVTATETAPASTLSTAHKLRLSAESRVQELRSANASLQRRLKEVSADLQQAENKMGKQETTFFQADKMRQRAEEDLSSVAAERNRLLRLVSDMLPEQIQANSLPSPADQDTRTSKEMPDVNCLQQTSPSDGQDTPDQTFPQTPIKTRPRPPAHDDTKQFQTPEQTDDHDTHIRLYMLGRDSCRNCRKSLKTSRRC